MAKTGTSRGHPIMVSSQVRVRIPWDYPFGGFHSHGGAPIAGWFFPHIIVWGSCFWICTSRLGRLLRLLLLLLRHTHSLSHTIYYIHLCHKPSFTHIFVTHTLFYTSLSHTLFYAHLCYTPSFTHIFVRHLCHTPSFTHIFVRHLCHTPSFTHNFVTHHLYTHLCQTIFHTHLCHTPFSTHHLSHTSFDLRLLRALCHTASLHSSLSHTTFHTRLCHTPSFTHHLSNTTFDLRLLRGAWRLATWSCILCGRRGTWSHPPSFRVTSVALMGLGWPLDRA